MWKIVKYRPCDGSCCVHSPRFPVTGSRLGRNPNTTKVQGVDCIYHLNTPGSPYGGCVLHKEALGEIPQDKLLKLSARERKLFEDTCLNWPVPRKDKGKLYTDVEREGVNVDFGEGICCHRWESV